MWRHSSLAAVALLAHLCLASPGLAQAEGEPTSSEMAAARQLFRTGTQHAQAARWAEARADFERSYGLAQVPVTLFSLAGALAELGELVSAAERYRQFLPQAQTGRAQRYLADAQRALADLEARIPTLTLSANGLEDGDVLRIDDDEVSRAALGVPFPLDPGTHEVAVVRGDEAVATASLTLTPAEARTLTLDVPASATAAAIADAVSPAEVAAHEPVEAEAPEVLATQPPAAAEPASGGAGRVVLWAVLGVAVVAGATTAILLTRDDPSPFRGSAGPGVVRFELTR